VARTPGQEILAYTVLFVAAKTVQVKDFASSFVALRRHARTVGSVSTAVNLSAKMIFQVSELFVRLVRSYKKNSVVFIVRDFAVADEWDQAVSLLAASV
jgi:Na+-transporting NADH:ubiquinone oxidoreductase subunit NqrD